MIRKVFLFIPVIAALTGCTSAEEKAANALVAEANDSITAANFQGAFALLDSVDRTYPNQIEARRKVTALRVQAMKEYSEKQLAVADSIIASLEPKLGDFEGVFDHVEGTDDINGYLVCKQGRVANFGNTTGIEARASDADYSFYISAHSADKKIGVTQVVLVGADGSRVESTALSADDPRSGDTDKFGTDLASFAPSEVVEIGEWCSQHPSTAATLILVGKAGQVEKPLSTTEVEGIGKTWQFSQVGYKLKHAQMLREKLERQLVIARDQEVNLE